jgi:hypothetical protein
MNDARLDISDGERAQVRRLMVAIQADLDCLAHAGTVDAHRAALATLGVSWAGLVRLLDIGPAPEVRACPHCGQVGMSAATLCGYCWKVLSPLSGKPSALQ